MSEVMRIAIPDEEILAEAWDRLRHLHDPELGVDLVGLGLIYRMEAVEGRLRVEMSLTTRGCPLSEVMPDAVERTLDTVPGVSRVQVDLVWDPPWTPEMMSDQARLDLGWR